MERNARMRVEVKEGIARFSVDVIVSITQCLTFTEIARLARCARTLNSCASLRLEGEVSPALARRQTLEDPAVLQKLTSAGARRRLLERARNLRSIVAPPSSRELLIEAHNSLSSSLRALNFVHTGSPDPMLFCAKDRLAVALSVLPHIHSLGLVCFRSPLKMSQLPDAIVTRTELRQLRIHMFEFSDVELDKLLGACPCLEFLAVTAMFTTAAASRVPNLSKLWLHPVGTFVVSTLQPLQRLEKLLLVSTVSRRLVLAPGTARVSLPMLASLQIAGDLKTTDWHMVQMPRLHFIEAYTVECALLRRFPGVMDLKLRPDCLRDGNDGGAAWAAVRRLSLKELCLGIFSPTPPQLLPNLARLHVSVRSSPLLELADRLCTREFRPNIEVQLVNVNGVE